MPVLASGITGSEADEAEPRSSNTSRYVFLATAAALRLAAVIDMQKINRMAAATRERAGFCGSFHTDSQNEGHTSHRVNLSGTPSMRFGNSEVTVFGFCSKS